MDELSNVVTSLGDYNSIPTSLTSNTTVVNIIEGLSLSLETNKINWTDGNLIYTITLDNQTDTPYTNINITDQIDTRYITLIEDSITINDQSATEQDYSYDDSTNILKINLDKVDATSKAIITFTVKKKYNDFFLIKSRCKVNYNDSSELFSNFVIVISPIKRNKKDYSCGVPYWRY